MRTSPSKLRAALTTIRTWVITIYRQTLLPGLEFADMTHSGVLATILSGLEPAVAIALSCIPLLRPLVARRNASRSRAEYIYNNSSVSPYSSKRKGRTTKKDGLSIFTDIDNDNSSEVHLQPIAHAHSTDVVDAARQQERRKSMPLPPRTILVERRWEIQREQG